MRLLRLSESILDVVSRWTLGNFLFQFAELLDDFRTALACHRRMQFQVLPLLVLTSTSTSMSDYLQLKQRVRLTLYRRCRWR